MKPPLSRLANRPASKTDGDVAGLHGGSRVAHGRVLATHLRLSRGVVTKRRDVGPVSLLWLTWRLWRAGTLAAQVNVLIAQRGDHLHTGQTAQGTDGADCNTAATYGVISEPICGVTSELPLMLLRQLRHGLSSSQ